MQMNHPWLNKTNKVNKTYIKVGDLEKDGNIDELPINRFKKKRKLWTYRECVMQTGMQGGIRVAAKKPETDVLLGSLRALTEPGYKVWSTVRADQNEISISASQNGSRAEIISVKKTTGPPKTQISVITMLVMATSFTQDPILEHKSYRLVTKQQQIKQQIVKTRDEILK